MKLKDDTVYFLKPLGVLKNQEPKENMTFF